MLTWGKNGQFFCCVTLKFEGRSFMLLQLFASFDSHRWIQTEIAVRKCPLGSKFVIFFPMWPDLERQRGTWPMSYQALGIITSPYENWKWSYGLETAKLGFDLCDHVLWPITSLLSMVITPGNFVGGGWEDFLRWWPTSAMWAGPLSLYGHHRGYLNNPIFSNLQLWALCWPHFMCHH